MTTKTQHTPGREERLVKIANKETARADKLQSACDGLRGLANQASKFQSERDSLAAENAELLKAMKKIDYEAEHHFTGCEPGPWKRMPPELREAIKQARAILARAAKEA